ncbi:MAG: beta-ketoacyl-ACP synthase II [Planctomycetota bacterium]|nr:beta-ketoacyl-ACP synthase II [Planctomycetota bacterium]
MQGGRVRTLRRVVVTGLGAVTPVGLTAPETFENLVAGRSGVGPVTLIDHKDFDVHFAAEVKGFDPAKYMSGKEARHLDRFSQFAIAAASEAIADAGLDLPKLDPTRAGVMIGTGIGGLTEIEAQYRRFMEKGPSRINPFLVPKMMANAAGGNAAIRFGLKGPNFCVVTACASGLHSMGEAFRIIQHGMADVMVAGGSEAAITHLGLGGFCAARALSTRNDDPQGASRPFDRDRDGFVLGEGAGVVVMESLDHAAKRGARIYAEVTGYGLSCDAFHITAPDDNGDGGFRAMRMAMEDAAILPEQYQYVSAHGTSTQLNDKVETLAIKKAFGDHARKLAVASIKSMIGHLLGASGSVAVVSAAMSIVRGVVPPTINYHTPDPNCDLDCLPNKAREMKVCNVLVNALGFGGHNGTISLSGFPG